MTILDFVGAKARYTRYDDKFVRVPKGTCTLLLNPYQGAFYEIDNSFMRITKGTCWKLAQTFEGALYTNHHCMAEKQKHKRPDN